MKKFIKIEELPIQKLNFWVAKAEGNFPTIESDKCQIKVNDYLIDYEPCNNWAIGGRIIQKECISLHVHSSNEIFASPTKIYGGSKGETYGGKTHLIAAMRCYVAAKFGAKVPAFFTPEKNNL